MKDRTVTQILFSTGPFVRYYILTKRALPFVEFGGIIGRRHVKEDDGDEERDNLTTFGGGIGAAAPLGDRVMLDLMVGYLFRIVIGYYRFFRGKLEILMGLPHIQVTSEFQHYLGRKKTLSHFID